MSEEIKETMADYAAEIEASFQNTRKNEESSPVWDALRELRDTKTVVTVKVKEVVKSGVVTELEGVRAFIPASKLALGFVSDEDMASYQGKKLQALVITAEEEGERLVLSAKDLLLAKEEEAKRQKMADMKVGAVVTGTVESLKDYGAFLRLENGLSGLLHVSQISQKRIKHPGAVLKEGESLEVKIIAIKDGKLSLSKKALEEATEEAPAQEEHFDLPETESLGTSLGDLLKGLKL